MLIIKEYQYKYTIIGDFLQACQAIICRFVCRTITRFYPAKEDGHFCKAGPLRGTRPFFE